MRARNHSVLMMAAISPDTSSTTTTEYGTVENQYHTIRYLEDALKFAMIHWRGFIESGAETPYADLAQDIVDYLEPLAFEQVAGSFPGTNYEVFSNFRVGVKVPGELQIGALSAG